MEVVTLVPAMSKKSSLHGSRAAISSTEIGLLRRLRAAAAS